MIKTNVRKKDLYIQESKLPESGMGLFTREAIQPGALIAEYTGRISTWKEAKHEDGNNGYIYYINRNRVIDARPYKKSLARYGNDAKGLRRQKSLLNNAEYSELGNRVFIKATKAIPAGTEILVGYGKEYWDVIKYNIKLVERERKKKK